MKYRQEINKIKEIVNNAEIVSFDIFDTLLLRNVMEPSDIFKIVEIEYYNQYNKHIDFYKERKKAELIARKKTKFEDITLDDIYDNFNKFFEKQELDLFRQLEIKIEKKFIIANRFMKEVFETAKEGKKQILLISDMYLSKDVITEFLEINGIGGYDKLYVSSDIKKSKATGSIYSHIKNDLCINNKKWIHIGDNYISDYKNSLNKGIEGIYYQALKDRERKIKIHNLTESILRSVQINSKYCGEKMDYWSQFGIMYVFPMYFGLMNDLMKKLRGKDNIYFLSRDGYMPYQLYNKLKKYYEDIPEAKYIYASRRSYVYPTLLVEDKSKVIEFLTIYNKGFRQNLTLRDILRNLDLKIETYKDVIDTYEDIDIDGVINEKNLGKVQNFLIELWDEIKLKLNEERELLLAYLKQEGLDKHNNINIFDIGWAGTTHKAIRDLLNKNVYGYYFGTNNFIDNYIKKNSYGYAFNNGLPYKKYRSVIKNVMIYELLFTAPEGSVKRFEKSGERIVPILKSTQNNESIEKVGVFQEAVFEAFNNILQYKEYLDDVTKEFSLLPIEKFIETKQSVDLVQFSQINNSVTIGETKDFKDYVIKVEDVDYKKNIKHYKALAHTSLWKDAVLIEDNQGRMFNSREFEKLHSIKDNFHFMNKLKKICMLVIKVVKNPQKVILKLFTK